jgi:nitrous oxidase accessory protein
MERKTLSGIMLTLLFTGMLTLALDIQSVKAEPKTLRVPTDYSTIQAAINAATPGDTIYVRAGTYYELVVVNKSLSLVGENRSTTIIDAQGRMALGAIQVIANNVNISGFTVRNSPESGIALWQEFPPYSWHDIVIQNNIITNNVAGIHVGHCTNVTLTNNLIANNAGDGVELNGCNNTIVNNNTITNNLIYGILSFVGCWNNKIGNNTITDNERGIKSYSDGNIISNNVIADNTYVGIEIYGSNNIVSHNSFFNRKQVVVGLGSVNIWDMSYPIGGNHWSDHAEVDIFSGPYQNETGSDGIEDRPYVIDANNIDRYPLMTPSLLSEHDLAASIYASDLLPIGTLTSIEVSAYNLGLNSESGVSLQLLIDDVIVHSEMITTIKSGSVYTFNYSWTPSAEGNHNLTAFITAVPKESTIVNNAKSVIVTVYTTPTKPTQIYISPSESHAMIDSTITVDVMVANVEDLWAWQVILYYNTTLLNCTDAWYPKGHVFDGKPFAPLSPEINATDGYIFFGNTLMGKETTTFYGSGILCTIQFKALKLGTSFLNFSLPYGKFPTLLLNPQFERPTGNRIPAETVNGFIKVYELTGDLNKDGIVDISDIAMAAKAFGSYLGHPRWNPDADLNSDGVVDIVDIATIATNFGKTYP